MATLFVPQQFSPHFQQWIDEVPVARTACVLPAPPRLRAATRYYFVSPLTT